MRNTAVFKRPLQNGVGLIAAALLAGCDGRTGDILPEGVSASDVALFKSTVAALGCDIDRRNAPLVTEQTGFDRDTLQIITQYLTLAGESEPTASGFRLTSGTCANA